jgi:hypothetical protein
MVVVFVFVPIGVGWPMKRATPLVVVYGAFPHAKYWVIVVVGFDGTFPGESGVGFVAGTSTVAVAIFVIDLASPPRLRKSSFR